MTANQPPSTPVTFLSHASEDKALFAEPLARELARRGIQPWLDKWEIKPGDSLVKKLFDEGLALSQAVVVVVSTYSATKPWVREELDHATVSRIAHGTRLIPVRLDGVDMPAPLQHLVWINSDRTDEGVKNTAEQIANAIYSFEGRPVTAPRPAYASTHATIPGLTKSDQFLLTAVLLEAMQAGHGLVRNWPLVETRAEQGGLTGKALEESLHAITEAGYVTITPALGGGVINIWLTSSGYLATIATVVPNIDDIHTSIITTLVNQTPTEPDALPIIAAAVGTSEFIVDEFLKVLERERAVNVIRFANGGTRVIGISPTLRRRLQ
ncbi:toll/interleukin-1 receptor domain-containing protein [Lentzea sp. NPDC060358]|uniref:toll/interleukin-1 receptor domain-containing protein n=1 Tax=Lentzea sp. NPDC060358 TaxID=3347103 RepID=UPI0036514A8A